MKLIDLDAKEPYLLDGRYAVGIPDNVSTVHHPNCDICVDKAKQYSSGFQDGYLTGKERPHGEWIRVDKDKVKCNKCEVIHYIAQYPSSAKIDYCPNCGARMKGGAE